MNRQLALRRTTGLATRRAFGYFATRNPKVAAAMKVGAFIYRHRKKIKRTYQTAKRFQSKYARRAFRQKALKPYHTVYTPDSAGYRLVQPKTFESEYIRSPVQGVGTTTRLTQQIYVKGIKMCLHLWNINDYPIEVHLALVQAPEDISTTAQLKDNWFRADDGTGGTVLNFQDFSASPTWDLRYLCNSLNPNNKRIITHRKYMLGRRTAPGGIDQSKPFLMFDKYFPIKRPQNLTDNIDTLPERPFAWVLWGLPLDGADMPIPPAGDLFKYNMRTKLYFKNIT